MKQCKAFIKKNGVKGVSRFNKKELNEKMLDVSEKTIKTEKMKNMIQRQALYFN